MSHMIGPNYLPQQHISKLSGISDLLTEVSKFQHHTKVCSKSRTLLVSSLNVSLRDVLFIFYSEATSLSSSVVPYFVSVVAGHHSLCRRVSTEHASDGTHGRLCLNWTCHWWHTWQAVSQLNMPVMAHMAGCVSTEHASDGTHGRLCEETGHVFHQFRKCHLKMLLGVLHESNKNILVGTF